MPYDKNRDSFRNDRTGASAYRGPRTGAPRRDVPPAVRDDGPSGRRGDDFPKNRDFNRNYEGRRPESRSYNRNYEGEIKNQGDKVKIISPADVTISTLGKVQLVELQVWTYL